MLNILVVESNVEDMEYCCKMIMEIVQDCCLYKADSIEGANELLNEHEIDVFLIAIRLSERNTFELASEIRQHEKYRFTEMVFLVADETDSCKINSMYHCYDLIRKPFSYRSVYTLHTLLSEKTQEKKEALSMLPIEKRNKIIVKSGSQHLSVKLHDLLFARVEGKYIKIVTVDRTIECIRMSLNDFITYIDDERFCRIHKAYAARTDKIKAIRKVDQRLWSVHFDAAVTEACYMSITYYKGVMNRNSGAGNSNILQYKK